MNEEVSREETAVRFLDFISQVFGAGDLSPEDKAAIIKAGDQQSWSEIERKVWRSLKKALNK